MGENLPQESMVPRLILIGGSPWVGKTACAEALFSRLNNCSWLDGDDVWRVNPFSLSDPRLRNSDKNMAFVLQTYLESKFDYVILSSVVLVDRDITAGILRRITGVEYELITFMLFCSVEALSHRCKARDGTSPDLRWLKASLAREGTVRIDSTDMTPVEVAVEIERVVTGPEKSGLALLRSGPIARWMTAKKQG